MVQIAALVLSFPAGYYIRHRLQACGAMTVVLGLLLIVQTISVGDADRTDPIYWVIQVVTFAVAAGLVTWGNHVAARRRVTTV